MDAHAAAMLLDDFSKLPDRTARPQTFMEIAGYPHYENVCSNFLAFFFDPEGPHDLGNLFLDALMEAVGAESAERSLGGNVTVRREVGTADGNRIDLLLKSDSHAVLIENKIFAAAVNPFEDYADYPDSLKNRSEESYAYGNKIKVLLTSYPSREGSDYGFRNLTHSGFASVVRARLGYYVSRADARYLTLMLDFLNTLENLGEGSRMNREFIELLANKSAEVEKFLIGLKQVRDEGREKVRKLGSLIDARDHQKIRQLPAWEPSPNHSQSHFLQYRVHIDEESYVVVQPTISPRGWEIQSFYRLAKKTRNRSQLEGLLIENKIPPENDLSIHPKRFDYDEENFDDIASVVQEELSRVAGIVQEIGARVS
jgi:hypothetical protein